MTVHVNDDAPVGVVSQVGLYDEVEAMIHTIQNSVGENPDVLMKACMGLMARCTEIWVQLVRVEAADRKAKSFRTMQLQKVMDLIDFEFKGASRLIEVARQEVELSR
jgi:hypothetical protein